jgi:hypothetical protein
LIPVRVSSVWRDEPGEMDGLMKRLEMREKSLGEKLGVVVGEFRVGVEAGLGWMGGRDGQWMSGFPGWESHEEENGDE